MSWSRGKRNGIFLNYTQKDFFSCVSNICSTSKYWEMQLINIIFSFMHTMKITMIIKNKELLLFVGCGYHFETTHKSLSIHAFFLQFTVLPWEMEVIKIIFLAGVHYDNYNDHHETKNFYCLLVADVMNKENRNDIFWNYTQKAFIFSQSTCYDNGLMLYII